LPDIEFLIGKHKYTVQPKNYVVKIPVGEGECMIIIAPLGGEGEEESSDSEIILGDSFMKSYYVHFMYGSH